MNSQRNRIVLLVCALLAVASVCAGRLLASTETPTQEILIDSNAPSATLSTYDLPDGNVTYTAQDGESGIDTIYITIEDKDGKYPKVKWTEEVSGKNVNGEHKWDGNLPGEIVAPAGESLVCVKAVDQAGNQGTQVGNISIPESDSLLALSTSNTPQADAPADLLESSETDDENDSPDLTYGGSTDKSTDTVSQSLTLSASASFTPNNPYESNEPPRRT